eukprot:3826967-Rhodomonas_salina.1
MTRQHQTLKEAYGSPHADKWREAVEEEMRALADFKAYRVVPRPRGWPIVSSKFVFKLKKKHGQVTRFKARLCCRGFSQTYGVDYADSHAAMAHPTAIRAVLALAAQQGWYTYQTDIRSAFMSGVLSERVYMSPPRGMEEPDKDGQVWELLKGVNGLKQGGSTFARTLLKEMYSFGFVAASADECVLIYTETSDGSAGRPPKGEKSILVVLTVVDDLVEVGNDKTLLRRMIDHLKKTFELTEDGRMEWFLGVAYRYDPSGAIVADQSAYLDGCLQRYQLTGINPKPTPMSFKLVLTANEEEPDMELHSYYRAVVGSLVWMASWTRPDVAQAVGYLARFLSRPTKAAVQAAHRVFAYLKGTANYSISFNPSGAVDRAADELLYAYTDSSDADCPVSRRSTGGYLVMYNGTPVSWSSSLQKILALSSCESEYIQAALAAKEVLHLRAIFNHLGFEQRRTLLYIDNEATVALSDSPVHRNRSKHIERRWHFLRQCAAEGFILATKISSEQNVADLFTKALGEEKFKILRHAMGVRDRQVRSGTVVA